MFIELKDHYQSMTVRLAPGIHKVNTVQGQYLIANGYAVEVDAPRVDAIVQAPATIEDELLDELPELDDEPAASVEPAEDVPADTTPFTPPSALSGVSEPKPKRK